jgi:PAS domain S-box-containing protein
MGSVINMNLIQTYKNSILAQISLLIGLFVISIVGLKVGHTLLEERERYLAELLENEQNRVEISYLLQNKLLSTNILLHNLANVFSYSEMERLFKLQQQLNDEISNILSVVDKGGILSDNYPVNLDNEEIVTYQLKYTNYSHERINLQVIELRAKLDELNQYFSDFEKLGVRKIEIAENPESSDIVSFIRSVNHFYKKVDPFFVRILENSNRLHFESQQEMERIRQINTKFLQSYFLIERTSTLLSALLILAAGTLVYRSSRNNLMERQRFQSELQELNENLEHTIQQRTSELENEIGERKNAQQQMGEQAEFLFNTIEALSHPFYVIDTDNYQIVLANSAALESSQNTKTTCHALTHNQETPCNGEDHPCPLKIVKNTGKPVTLEHIHSNHQGDKRYVEIHGYPIFDESGKISRMIEYSLDVTEKKEAEKALKKANDRLEEKVKERTSALEEQIAQRRKAERNLATSEGHYRRLVENISDIVTIVSRNGEITYTSPSVMKILGMTPESVSGRSIKDLIHHDDAEDINIQSLYEKHLGGLMEHRVITSEGKYKILESFIQKFKQDDETDAYILNSRDVTLRKAAEEETHKLQMVVEQSPSSVVITDILGTIEYVNPAFEEITGYSFAEVVGQNPRILQSGKTSDAVFKALWIVLSAGKIWRGEFINKKKNGEFYEENVLILPIKNLSGDITNYVAVKENITELKRAQKQAEGANQAKSNFLSRMSHELRTPLNAINGFSQLMLKSKKNPLNEKQQNMTQQISIAGNHLLELINEVLDLARIESGEFSMSLEKIDPQLAIDECLALIEPMAMKRKVIVSNQNGLGMPMIRADFTRLKQVLLNLMSNAVKYNEAGGTVDIRCFIDTPGFLRFVVVDDGYGIAEQKQKDMFTPFTRMVENPDEIEGTGIGMTISKQLVEAMGGNIDFSSKIGVGSSFWFTIPLCTRVPSLDSLEKTTSTRLKKANSSVGYAAIKQVLYIEDNPVNASFMKALFEDLSGYHLNIATTGEDGLVMALENVPSLVLLDLNLPGIDGFQVFRQLKDDFKTKAIPIIAVTADAMEQTVNKVIDAGFNGYLSKPIDVDLLHNTIADVLEVG